MNVILLNNTHCLVKDNNTKSKLIQKGYGFLKEKKLLLDLFESNYLLEKKKINIIDLKNKKITRERLLDYSKKEIKDFKDKYIVFKDFREKGYIIKDGAIFGFDFRIYENNNLTEHTHTKYVVDVLRSQKDTINKLIKSERLANNIKTTYILAILDMEDKIIKLKIERMI